MQQLIFKISLLLVFCFFMACGSSTKSDCQFGEPQAIFSPDLPEVVHHQFEQKGQEATEELAFSDQFSLKLFQSGCNQVKQEFRFQIPGTFDQQDAIFWVDQGVSIFQRLARLSDKQVSFFQWAQVLEAARDQIQFGQRNEIQPAIFLKIDKIISPDQATLIVELSQGEEG